MRLSPDQDAICDAIRDYPRVAVMASHGVGKCLAPDAWLTVDGGSRVQAKTLVGRVFTLTTLAENGALVQASARAEPNVVEPVWTLTTVTGAQIQRNGKHLLWAGSWSIRDRTVRPRGWVAIEDLQYGDFIAAPNALPAGNAVCPQDFLYLAGALYGDDRAHVTLLGWNITADTEHMDLLREIARRQGGSLVHKQLADHPTDRLMLHNSDKLAAYLPFLAWLKAEGAPSGDIEARVTDFGLPSSLWSLDNHHLGMFLAAAFRQGAGHVDAVPRFRSRSSRVLQETQELLLRFGVESLIFERGITVSTCRTIRELLTVLGGEAAPTSREAWVSEYAPPSMHWTLVDTVAVGPPALTVALEVPTTGTFVTTLYEHNTYIMAGLTLWRYVCFEDSKVITTAPGEDSVKDLLWGLVRKFWEPRPGLMPSAPELHDPERPRMSHYAVGRVAARGEGFQGRHDENLMVIFDEAIGIDRQFWLAAHGMCTDPNNRWVAIFNPTDISSAAYAATLDPKWKVISISALQHPNVLADLAGQPRPFGGAVSKEWVDDTIASDSTLIDGVDADPSVDFEWPPGSGTWWHPGFDTETRALGRWPSVSTDAIWSEQMWALCLVRQAEPVFEPIVIGCDVAAGGDNDTAIVVRRGPCALWAENHNGWDSTRTASRLRQLCDEYGQRSGQAGQTVQVNIDETGGYGRGVIDQGYGYSFLGVHSSSTAMDAENFPNRRSELWFTTANLAKTGGLDLSRLDPVFLAKLRGNFMAVRWVVNPTTQQRVVEPKAKTIKRLGTSPDPADATNLAYAGGTAILPMLPMVGLRGGWSR